MIFDLEREDPGAVLRTQICIVGGGAAGITLAIQLARHGKQVVILEAGGADVEERSQEPLQSEVVGQQHRGIHVGRFRAHGGTTRRWGGQILELDPIDFAERPWVPGSGWPITRESLKGAYARALEIEGVHGALLDDAEVWRALGLKTPAFAGMEPFFTRWCVEPDFSHLHRSFLEGPDVKVWLHAAVTGMEMAGERIQRLTARSLTGRTVPVEADEFLFAQGCIESCRFFLQPRQGGLPWNRSGLLGKYFQDHLDCNAARVEVKDAKAFHRAFDNVFLRGRKYHPKLKLSPKEQEQKKVLQVAATMNFTSDLDEGLAAVKGVAKRALRGQIGSLKGKDAATLLRYAPILAKQTARMALAHRAWNPESATVNLRVHCEQEPHSASSIVLSDERDSMGMLRTRLDWRIAETELRTMQVFVRQAAEALSGMAAVTPRPELLAGGDALRAICDDSNHHMGGMRMHDDPSRGVVTTDLRLHGTANAFVVSSAVFPTSGFSNPTHTVLALAVRLADQLGAR